MTFTGVRPGCDIHQGASLPSDAAELPFEYSQVTWLHTAACLDKGDSAPETWSLAKTRALTAASVTDTENLILA